MSTLFFQETYLPPPALDRDTIARFGLVILLDLGGLPQLWSFLPQTSKRPLLMRMLGLPESAARIRSQVRFEALLQQRRAELGPWTGDFGPVLDASLQNLADTLGLSAIEYRILGLAALLGAHECLAKLASQSLGEMDFLGLAKICARLLGNPESIIRAALATDGLLAQSGLLAIDRKARNRLHAKFELLDGLVDALCTGPAEVQALIARWIPPATAATLTLKDYPHRRPAVEMARRLLVASLKAGRPGVNLLLYGPPGTGKTELAKGLAAAMGVALYTVPTADAQGDPISGVKRLRCYRLAQHVLSRQERALLLFDEVEDVFPNPIGVRLGTAELTKGWINATLEGNPLPALWVCNDIQGLDHAYLRRFDQVIELGVPPQGVRAGLIEAHTRGLSLSRAWKTRAALHPDLSPALLRKAVGTVATAGYRSPATTEAALEMQLNATLTAMGYPPLPRTAAPDVLPYRPACLNADHDLGALVQGLRRDPRGRLCLYGPPGTGKSAFGGYVARTLQRPLLVKRASDLLGSLVGQSEKRIAGMFQEAESEQAVLLLDEADSFLRDRQEARMSWEVSQVNELLTQMEGFDGVFIASTNLLATLDEAALRRFDLKIQFGYLRPEQAWTLFRATLRQTGGRLTQPRIWQERLVSLAGLTPGDFATQVRRQRLAQTRLTPETLFQGLTAEIALKKDPTLRSGAIGFLAPV